ncbi:CcdB family protein [Devosia sp. SL43]|uniref:CcdB family protein n=1 Tax=Devosia sp. SL43 TaxID=2806348 RepID=UPI001F201622|nr:CcdB family protein [Devosia sp. SL43]UJW85717.1 CcdB family protein [Devosia sp. SL43]
MARFDVYLNPDGKGYLLDVQANLLDALNTRIVVPLIPEAVAPTAAQRLNPIFEIEAERCVMVTQFMAAVPRAILRAPLTNLAAHDTEIANALDMAFVGF